MEWLNNERIEGTGAAQKAEFEKFEWDKRPNKSSGCVENMSLESLDIALRDLLALFIRINLSSNYHVELKTRGPEAEPPCQWVSGPWWQS